MKIETKFDPKQKVFFLFENRVCTEFIEEIKITIDSAGIQYVEYIVNDNPMGSPYGKLFLEEQLFTTKQDLLDSL